MEILVAQGKTTGVNNPEAFIFYTKLNLQRLQRWDKTFHLNEALTIKAKIVKPQIWWLITEAWCGDAAQTLPVMNKIVENSAGNIELRIIMRDENLSIMDHYLTNGVSRSIPILVAVDKNDNELFHWGPRPQLAQKMMMDWKVNNAGITFNDIEKEIHAWYAKDKGETTEQELLVLLQ